MRHAYDLCLIKTNSLVFHNHFVAARQHGGDVVLERQEFLNSLKHLFANNIFWLFVW